MPDTTVAVKQDGTGDYTTISSAVAAANVSSGYYKIEIQDSNQYSEQVVISTASTTSSNYVWLTVASANRHQGVAGTGHARVTDNTASGAVIDMNADYTRVEYLDIYHASNGHGIEAQGNDPLISRCVIRGYPGSGVYGVWFQGGFGAIDNSVIYGFSFGVYVYQYFGVSANYVDYCTVMGNSTSGIHADKGLYHTTGSYTVYNTVAGDNDTYDFSSYGWSSGSFTWNGSHNAWDTNTAGFGSATTNNLTNSQNISSGGVTTTTTTANAYICTDLTSGSENYTPVPATGSGSNLALLNGVNRQGSEPDSRQDFSTDIRGKARPTGAGEIDIGAFQISGAPLFKYWNGSAFVDANAVQYWNGSAWTDVNAIQYWTGSAWADIS